MLVAPSIAINILTSIVAAFTMSPLVSSLSPSSPSARAGQTIFPECEHKVSACQIHYEFDANIKPVVSVDPGAFVHVETQDCFGGQITPNLEHPSRVLTQIPRSKLNPVSGPIYVNGAMPGDILCVTLHDIRPQGIGVACCNPRSGQLSHLIRPNEDNDGGLTTKFFDLLSMDDCRMMRMRDNDYRDDPVEQIRQSKKPREQPPPPQDTSDAPNHSTAALSGDMRHRKRIDPIIFPMAPMLGVIGVAPDGDHAISTIPAGKHGGNLDNNCNGIGSTIYLKVNHPGALLSIGDMHASQGDGEISGNGVEIGGHVLLQCDVIKAKELYDIVNHDTSTNFATREGKENPLALEYPITETSTHWITHGVYEENIPYTTTLACQEAAKVLIGQWGFTIEEAYIFLSVKGNLGLCQSCHPDVGTQIAKMSVPKLPMCPRPFRFQWEARQVPPK